MGQVRISDGLREEARAASPRVKVEAFQEGSERMTYLNQSCRGIRDGYRIV